MDSERRVDDVGDAPLVEEAAGVAGHQVVIVGRASRAVDFAVHGRHQQPVHHTVAVQVRHRRRHSAQVEPVSLVCLRRGAEGVRTCRGLVDGPDRHIDVGADKEVGVAVAVQVHSLNRGGRRAGLRIGRGRKAKSVLTRVGDVVEPAAALSVEETDLSLRGAVAVSDREVHIAVEIQIGDAERRRVQADRVRDHRLERAVPVARKYPDRRVAGVEHGDVEEAVLIEVAKRHLRCSHACLNAGALHEVARAVVQQHDDEVGAVGGDRDNVRLAIAVHVAYCNVAYGMADRVGRLREGPRRVPGRVHRRAHWQEGVHDHADADASPGRVVVGDHDVLPAVAVDVRCHALRRRRGHWILLVVYVKGVGDSGGSVQRIEHDLVQGAAERDERRDARVEDVGNQEGRDVGHGQEVDKVAANVTIISLLRELRLEAIEGVEVRRSGVDQAGILIGRDGCTLRHLHAEASGSDIADCRILIGIDIELVIVVGGEQSLVVTGHPKVGGEIRIPVRDNGNRRRGGGGHPVRRRRLAACRGRPRGSAVDGSDGVRPRAEAEGQGRRPRDRAVLVVVQCGDVARRRILDAGGADYVRAGGAGHARVVVEGHGPASYRVVCGRLQHCCGEGHRGEVDRLRGIDRRRIGGRGV